MKIAYLNGSTSSLALTHRALAFGDGLFETLRYHQGKLEFLDAHLARLLLGIKRLQLKWSQQETELLIKELHQTVDAISPRQQTHVVKIMLLRSSPGRGYSYDPLKQQTDRVIQCEPYVLPESWLNGVNVVAGFPISENSFLAGIKHLNRLDSVMAKAEAQRQNMDEMLMLDTHQNVIEGSMSNVFFKLDGAWVTPKLTYVGILGVVRQSLLDRYDLFEPKVINVSDLVRVESAFLCNSLIGLIPINYLENRLLQQDSFIVKLRQELQGL